MENQKTKTELHPNEAWLLETLRKRYRFGSVEIKMHDSVPQWIEKSRGREYPPKVEKQNKI